MAFDLCFTDEFLFNEGEPYDWFEESNEPTSLWQAIVMMQLSDPVRWGQLADEHFGCSGKHLAPSSVYELAKKTNTCTDLVPPVEVWIDENGFYTVKVYDK